VDEDPSRRELDGVEKLIIQGLKLAKLLPSNFAKAAETFVQLGNIAGYTESADVAGGNHGLRHILTKRMESSGRCTALRLHYLSKRFGQEIDNDPNLPLEGRPHLKSRSTDYGLEPGWLWKDALRLAGGDPNEALFLIGALGNDDYQNQIFVKNFVNSADEELSEEQMADFLNIWNSFDHRVSVGGSATKKYRIFAGVPWGRCGYFL